MKASILLLTLLIVFFLLSSSSQQFVSQKIERVKLAKLEPGLRSLTSSSEKVRVIVWLDKNKPLSTSSLKRIGEVKYEYDIIPAVTMEVSASQLENLEREPSVERIVLDRKLHAFRADSTILIKADNASGSFGVNGTGINISIVDTGVFNHSEFQTPNRIIKQKCYCTYGTLCPDGTDEDDNATDDEGHGTHCTGIAAGELGVANGSSIFAVKTMDSSGTGYDSDTARGIEWAFLNGANVISLSLGGCVNATIGGTDCYEKCYDSASSRMIESAVGNGTVVVAAIGNCGPNPSAGCFESGGFTTSAPACAKGAIAVGSVDDTDTISDSSSQGPTDYDNRTKPDLTAPGVTINSTSNSANGYATVSGTSQAAPHVAGVAVLVIKRYNQTFGYLPDPDLVKTILMTGVNTTGMSSSYSQRNNVYGSGRIDAYESLRLINSSVNYTKNDTISTGEIKIYKVNVTTTDFKSTLYWSEDADTYNNLDLIVGNRSQNFSYTTHANDTIEQVFLIDAKSGFWNVYINATLATNQEYFFVSNMDILDDVTAPSLILEKPDNTTYTNNTDISLNFTTDVSNHTIWYEIDGVNETKVTANTTFNVSDGVHNITLYVNDSYDNINQSTQFFTVDSTSPKYYDNSTNSTIAGTIIEFRLNWTDNVLLSGYIFSLDNGNTSFVNYTWTEMTGTGNWSNKTETANSTLYTIIKWKVYTNDTGNNWNVSQEYSFNTTPDTTAPTWPSNVTSDASPSYSPGQDYQFNVTWGDNVAIDTVFVEHNFTSSLHNDSFNGSEGGEYYLNVSDLVVDRYVWKSYANDSSNVWNKTDQWVYDVDKGPTNISLYLNGTRGDKSYQPYQTANFTVALNVSGKNVNLTSNITGFWNQTGLTPLMNYTNLTTVGVFNITGYWFGDTNYSSDSETWYATVTTTTVATTTTISGGDGGSNGGTASTSTSTTTSITTSVITTSVLATTSIISEEITSELIEETSTKTYWYVIPVMVSVTAVVVFIVWFKFFRGISEEEAFRRLKEKWASRSS